MGILENAKHSAERAAVSAMADRLLKKLNDANDYNERTLQAGESITIHGQNPDACVTITAEGDGNLDITADKVSSIVIPTTTPANIIPGALYIKE